MDSSSLSHSSVVKVLGRPSPGPASTTGLDGPTIYTTSRRALIHALVPRLPRGGGRVGAARFRRPPASAGTPTPRSLRLRRDPRGRATSREGEGRRPPGGR